LRCMTWRRNLYPGRARLWTSLRARVKMGQ
jgi:hypothetical protein